MSNAGTSTVVRPASPKAGHCAALLSFRVLAIVVGPVTNFECMEVTNEQVHKLPDDCSDSVVRPISGDAGQSRIMLYAQRVARVR